MLNNEEVEFRFEIIALLIIFANSYFNDTFSEQFKAPSTPESTIDATVMHWSE